MFLFLLPSKLLKIAKDLSRLPGTFNKWASEHIVRELSDFLCQNSELQYVCNTEKGYQYKPELEKEHYLNFDGYWMLQCKDENEL